MKAIVAKLLIQDSQFGQNINLLISSHSIFYLQIKVRALSLRLLLLIVNFLSF